MLNECLFPIHITFYNHQLLKGLFLLFLLFGIVFTIEKYNGILKMTTAPSIENKGSDLDQNTQKLLYR